MQIICRIVRIMLENSKTIVNYAQKNKKRMKKIVKLHEKFMRSSQFVHMTLL